MSNSHATPRQARHDAKNISEMSCIVGNGVRGIDARRQPYCYRYVIIAIKLYVRVVFDELSDQNIHSDGPKAPDIDADIVDGAYAAHVG